MLSLDGHARLLDPRAWPIHALSFVVAGILQSYFVLTVFDHYASASISPYVVDTLFIFYQPLLVTLSMLWFWVVVVRFFEAYAVKFDACFMPEHHRHLMLSSHICEIATCMTLVVSGSMALFVHLCATGALLAASYQPSLLYIFLVGMWCMPLDILHREDRLFYATTLRRVVLPIQVRSVKPSPSCHSTYLRSPPPPGLPVRLLDSYSESPRHRTPVQRGALGPADQFALLADCVLHRLSSGRYSHILGQAHL